MPSPSRPFRPTVQAETARTERRRRLVALASGILVIVAAAVVLWWAVTHPSG